MIIEYLADNIGLMNTDDEHVEHSQRVDLAPGFLTRAYLGGTLQALRPRERLGDALGGARTGIATQPQYGGEERSIPNSAYAPMDNRHAFAQERPAREARPRHGCRSCGRGDVNVHVNVATGTNSASSSGTEQSAEPRQETPHVPQPMPVLQPLPVSHTASPPSDVSADLRRIVAEELQAVRPQMAPASVRPCFEQPKPKPDVVYRAVMVPQDRVVTKTRTIYKPFAVVWDRIKRVAVPRDVVHPIDRVKKVPVKNVRGSFEVTQESQGRRPS